MFPPLVLPAGTPSPSPSPSLLLFVPLPASCRCSRATAVLPWTSGTLLVVLLLLLVLLMLLLPLLVPTVLLPLPLLLLLLPLMLLLALVLPLLTAYWTKADICGAYCSSVMKSSDRSCPSSSVLDQKARETSPFASKCSFINAISAEFER